MKIIIIAITTTTNIIIIIIVQLILKQKIIEIKNFKIFLFLFKTIEKEKIYVF